MQGRTASGGDFRPLISYLIYQYVNCGGAAGGSHSGSLGVEWYSDHPYRNFGALHSLRLPNGIFEDYLLMSRHHERCQFMSLECAPDGCRDFPAGVSY